MPGGKGIRLKLTGQLGDVMRESAEAALSWVRSHADMLGLTKDQMKPGEIHLHIPAGAVPKDGPSAGIALVTAIVSALSNRKTKSMLAMTGEISLRGRVLPVGGIKGKLFAASRAGIETIVMPRRNEKDLSCPIRGASFCLLLDSRSAGRTYDDHPKSPVRAG